MPPDVAGLFDAIFGITVLSILATLAIPLLIVIVVIWAVRRAAPRDPAEAALRQRLAQGEIDQAEFLVRMRALHDGDDPDIT